MFLSQLDPALQHISNCFSIIYGKLHRKLKEFKRMEFNLINQSFVPNVLDI